MACENMQVTFVVTGDSGGCSFLCNSPGSGPRGLGRDEGELVVGERSKGCYQRQGCLLQMVEIYALEINSHSPIHFKWHQNWPKIMFSYHRHQSCYLACTGQATESRGRERAREHCKDNCQMIEMEHGGMACKRRLLVSKLLWGQPKGGRVSACWRPHWRPGGVSQQGEGWMRGGEELSWRAEPRAGKRPPRGWRSGSPRWPGGGRRDREGAAGRGQVGMGTPGQGIFFFAICQLYLFLYHKQS